MALVDRLAKVFLNKAVVIHKEKIAENAFRLSLGGTAIKKLKYTVGQHLRVFIGVDKKEALGEKVRTYSIWNIDQEKGQMDMAICSHSIGPGSDWIKTIAVGQEVYFSSPKGKFTLDESAENYLFIGDSSALGHLYEIRRHLGEEKQVQSIIYAQNADQLFSDIDGKKPFNFYQFPENPSEQIKTLLQQKLTSFPPDDTIVYVGGDGRLCIALNHFFRKEQNWSSKRIKTKPFWLPNKKGLE